MTEITMEYIKELYNARTEANALAAYTIYENDKKNDPDNAEFNRYLVMQRIWGANKRLEDAIFQYYDNPTRELASIRE